MNRHLDSLLAIAERAVTVSDLVGGQELWFADPSRPAEEVAAEMRRLSYDVAPLREQPVRRFVVADELDEASGPAGDSARIIDAGLLVSGSLPLGDAIAGLGSHPFLFVLERDSVTHLLARADLQLPPVSLVTLGFITAAEAALDILIERRLGEEWIAKLTPERRGSIEGLFMHRRAYNADITRLKCANLDDRLAIAAKVPALWSAAGSPSRRQFEDRVPDIKRLRNNLAHGNGLLDALTNPRRAVELFADVRSLATSLWAAVERDDALFDAFAGTSIRLVDPDVVIAGPGAVSDLPLLSPVHVITAWNPAAEVNSPRQNRSANDRLESRLRDLGYAPVAAVGWAGEWAEDSFAVTGLPADKACALGSEFGQAAVFQVDNAEVRVLECTTGVVRRRRPRRWETTTSDAR